ncbi:MAG: UDP-N-acetylglucosamine 2-epimerase (non-hydrolyzing) [Candidatus Omnitrophica bacterium]|nr:UDP-N-acetylglucosamine 2-epimerase (non-hydrolyzing) [Candidatus Omnitrophota bacterium]
MRPDPGRKILFVFGTRPEALKLAPVISAARKDKRFRAVVCLTAQHRQMVDQVLDIFRIRPDYDLDIMRPDQTLGDLTQRLFSRLKKVTEKERPGLVMVQGDTTTAFAVALKSFYQKIPVAHVEAGLRTFDKYRPFPEEINRALITRLADFHFAPTPDAKKNLLREGVSPDRVFVTGNTVVDALNRIRSAAGRGAKRSGGKKMILVTAHRRESFGPPLEAICRALADLARRNPGIEILYPVHLNPRVQVAVRRILSGVEGVRLLPPLSYRDMIAAMERCYFILTDSGGIQEEAPSFGKPVLVLREVSERPEGIRLGVARLVGTDPRKILREAERLLRDPRAYASMVRKRNPYGDGKASERILDHLARRWEDTVRG